MNQSQPVTAEEVINTYSQEDLHRILGQYGEVRNARTLAQVICQFRTGQRIDTIGVFADIVRKLAPRGKENKYMAQVFQGIRIEVNEELKALEELLEQSSELLKPSGKLVIMSYHSLEDRLVKNFINKGKFFGDVERDLYGNHLKPLTALTRKPIIAGDNEINENNRARSAKLRIAEKN
jgi:16S rRNA (cytosine1402-N4)-methyltransferase